MDGGGGGGGEAMSMSMSFKFSLRSPMASFLESSISSKLRRYISNYSDDILSEYITVLVCNGKDQYQAKQDLDAFLGDKTTEFVEWLWDLLYEYARKHNEEVICFTHSKHANVDKNEFKGIREQASGYEYDDHKDATRYTLLSPRYPALTPQSSTGYQGMSQVRRKGTLTKLGAVEDKKSNSGCVQQNTKYMDQINKIVSSNFNAKSKEHSQLPNRELGPRKPESSLLEQPCLGQIYSEKPRVSVWDRLGKPSDKVPASQTALDVNLTDVEKHKEVLKNSSRELRLSVDNVGRRILKENTPQGDELYGEKPLILDHGLSNNGRKRHFGDLSTGPVDLSASFLTERNADSQHDENSKGIKKPNLEPRDLKPNLNVVSLKEMAVVKKKLRQVQMEMVKLRSKQMEMLKDGNTSLLSQSGAFNHADEDIDPKAVYVKNVHFAASKEALSSYFSKCGTIKNVIMLTDKATGQPKGSAFITFTDEESVDRAVALAGSTFLSRQLKIFRTMKTSAAALEVKLSETPSYQSSGKLESLRTIVIPDYTFR
ncbi:hypothetical protein ACFE04_001548 [Oxalis oulophora]